MNPRRQPPPGSRGPASRAVPLPAGAQEEAPWRASSIPMQRQRRMRPLSSRQRRIQTGRPRCRTLPCLSRKPASRCLPQGSLPYGITERRALSLSLSLVEHVFPPSFSGRALWPRCLHLCAPSPRYWWSRWWPSARMAQHLLHPAAYPNDLDAGAMHSMQARP